MINLQNRISFFMDIPRAVYEIGAYLGFFEEFGNKPFQDPWHGHKEIVSHLNSTSYCLYKVLQTMINNNMLEMSEDQSKVKWNSNFKL